jgi:hypothetical protein
MGATVAAALTRDMLSNLPTKLWARWGWSILKLFPKTAQALDINITVDWDYVPSDENRTQLFYWEEGQKCLIYAKYFQQRPKWFIPKPLVKSSNKMWDVRIPFNK